MQQQDSPVARFEAAVEAIISGDAATLARLLREDPALVRARSARKHRSTLLHYVGANGVEGFRQKTPKNAVAIARMLLDAGADVESTAGMYGGSTTLGLVATSIHPQEAGVQEDLMALLIDRGAKVDGGFEEDNTGGYTAGAVNGCLANGRPAAAEFLARRGARLDLEGAAGIGRLDLVRSFFDEDGSLKPTATPKQMRDGFSWACEYGRTEVVDFLLQRGMDVGARLRPHGQTGLHWAALGAHESIVKLLLQHGSPVDVLDETFNGTALGWAIYAWGGRPPGAGREPYYEVVARLARAGATVAPEWLEPGDRGLPLDEHVRADARMQAALRGDLVGGRE